MQTTPTIYIVLIASIFLTSCPVKNRISDNGNSADRNANSANSNTVKDNIDELEITIKIPFHPIEAVWREENLTRTGDQNLPAATGKKLVAVIRFSKEDADKAAAQAARYKPAAAEMISTENWFPAELIAQSQTSGDETLRGTTYAATDFLNAPYTEGKITRIDGTDYFVLELLLK